MLHHRRDSLGRYPYDGEFKDDLPISVTVQGPTLTLTSRKWIVHIPVPEEPGIQSFIYK